MLYNQVVNKFARLCGALLMVCLLLTTNGGHVVAQQGGTSEYFPATGHTVSGEFWTFYQSIENADYVLGAPITEQFSDAKSGRVIQYFQRARFEYYPENAADQRVLLTAVGSFVMEHAVPSGELEPNNPIGCRKFDETGFSVCYAFLEFFDKNGGEWLVGKPISPFVFYNGRIVQYFERARFEWFPQNLEGQKVVLAELGRLYFDLLPEDAARLQPVRAENAPGDVRALAPNIFTWKAVTRTDDSQAVYVTVRDQTNRPVAGATAIITIHWAQGGEQRFAQTTDGQGLVNVPLRVQNQPHGSLAVIDVEVNYMGLSEKIQSSFRIWQ